MKGIIELMDVVESYGDAMVIYLSILIYTTIVSKLVFMNSNKRFTRTLGEGNVVVTKVGMLGAMVSLALLIFFMGIRGAVSDTSSYISIFWFSDKTMDQIGEIFSDPEVKGVLWEVYMVFFKNCISDNFIWWLVSIATFQGFAVAKFFVKYSEQFDFSCYLFVAGATFTWMLNGIRQFTAVCIVLLALEWFFKKKYIGFLLAIVIAYGFHNTVLIWLAFFLFIKGKPFNKNLIIVMLVVCAVLASGSFDSLLNSALEGSNYEDYVSTFQDDDGVNPISVLLYAIPTILSFISRKRIEAIEHPKYIDYFINMSCITVVIAFVGIFTSGVLIGRLPIYFSMVDLVLLPWIIENGFDKGIGSIMKVLCYICYLIYFFISLDGLGYHSLLLHANFV